MRAALISLLCLAATCTALAQTTPAKPAITRYMVFTGTIDKYPVTFHIYRINNEFSGSYYYNNMELPIGFLGSLDNKQFLKLTAVNNGNANEEIMEGNFKDSSFSGTWSYKGKMLPIHITQRKGNNNLTFDYIWVTGSKKIVKKEAYDRDRLSYEASVVWPSATSTHPATDFVKQIIREEFGAKSSQDEIGKLLIKSKNDALNPAVKEYDGICYTNITTVQVDYQTANLLCLSKSFYCDAGGAHGNYGIRRMCLDLVDKSELSLTDVIDTLAGRSTIQALLIKQFRSAYHVKKEEKLSDYLLEEEIPITDNFYVTSRGILFNYNPYEIGPFSMGVISIFIPYKEVAVYLKPEFKQLVGL